jgi:hypothetical protein
MGKRQSSKTHSKKYSRNNEVDQTIANDQGDDTRATGVEQFVSSENKHNEVEAHGVDEGRRENCIVHLGDDATLLWDPSSLEENAAKKQGPMTEDNQNQGCNDVPHPSPNGQAGKPF